MKNQFITKTFPNHQSIATGLRVESHGFTDNWVFDPAFNRTFGEKDHEFWKFDDGILLIWTLNEFSGGTHSSGIMMWPGSNYGYGPHNTLPSLFLHRNESLSWSWRVDTVIDWLTHKTKPVNLVFMYFEDPDEFVDGFGPESN
ncbi:unnamed protein product [Allacma fusca]|uniref:Uncharacterized protein n=1 Tax=Allacma fusca TaxID=39272 RepID=A0A8J2LA02_9HEXA|nr:unnamed protein product [Allacma fusca]